MEILWKTEYCTPFFQHWLCRRTFLNKHCPNSHNFHSHRLVREDAEPNALGKILFSLCLLFQLVSATSVPAAARGIDNDEI